MLDAAIAYATDHGAVVVIAAGNLGSSDPAFPAAGASEAIRVAATDAAGTLFPWSDHGGWVDLAAPGNPSVLLATGGVSTAVLGTSLSAPLVAGVAGLLLSWEPTLAPAAVKDALLRGGAADPGLDVASGRRLDAFGALRRRRLHAAAQRPADAALIEKMRGFGTTPIVVLPVFRANDKLRRQSVALDGSSRRRPRRAPARPERPR